MAHPTLRDVAKSAEKGESRLIRPVNAWLINFSAPTPFPGLFIYQGCTVDCAGLPCATSVHSLRPCCHNPKHTGEWSEFFKFALWFCDESLSTSSPPLQATIFQATKKLLGISPEDFSTLCELEQIQTVILATGKMTLVEASFRVKAHDIVVTSMNVVQDFAHPETASPRFLTPKSRLESPVKPLFNLRGRAECSFRDYEAELDEVKGQVKDLTARMEKQRL
ncbi:unnamed protein product [Calypogeia fissa]